MYEGLVYMDLATNMLEERGYGEYENLEVPEDELPQVYTPCLALCSPLLCHLSCREGCPVC